MMIKHSILILTYNQIGTIRSSIESVLGGNILPFEIIISDDASTDGTVDVLMEYQSKYPDLIHVVAQKNNLGIFGNLDFLRAMFNGNIISFLAGDDLISKNLLTDIDRTILSKNLDPEFDKFCVLPSVINYKNHNKVSILENNLLRIFGSKYARNLAVRHLIANQNIGFSKAMMENWDTFSNHSNTTIGLFADFPHYIRLFDCSVSYYFVPHSYAIRVEGVGITSRVSKIEQIQSYNNAVDYLINSTDITLSDFDKKYLIKKKNYNKSLIAQKSRITKSLLWVYSKLDIFIMLSAIDIALGIIRKKRRVSIDLRNI